MRAAGLGRPPAGGGGSGLKRASGLSLPCPKLPEGAGAGSRHVLVQHFSPKITFWRFGDWGLQSQARGQPFQAHESFEWRPQIILSAPCAPFSEMGMRCGVSRKTANGSRVLEFESAVALCQISTAGDPENLCGCIISLSKPRTPHQQRQTQRRPWTASPLAPPTLHTTGCRRNYNSICACPYFHGLSLPACSEGLVHSSLALPLLSQSKTLHCPSLIPQVVSRVE